MHAQAAVLRAASDVSRAQRLLAREPAESPFHIQIQTDPRYLEFVPRAERREVLGTVVPVAAIEDLLQGKIWAASDPARRPSKRQKDLADIARIIESYPGLRERVPEDILARLE